MRKHYWLAVSLLCIAWVFLLFRLDSIPTGFQHDQMFDATNALQVLGGEFPIYFPVNFGLEPGFMYAAAAVFRLAGGHYVWSLRFTGVMFALAGLAASFVFARHYLGRLPALFASALMATSFWFLLAGRLGLEPIALLPLALASLHFLLKAQLRPSLRAYLLAGLLIGASNYVYLAARTLFALPLVLLICELLAAVAARLRRGTAPALALPRIGGLLAAFVTAIAVNAPMQAYILAHPAQTDGRIGELSGPLHAAWAEGNLEPLLTNVFDTVRAVFWGGSQFLPYHYNLPGHAVLQPLWAAFAVLGLLVALTRLADRRQLLLLVALLLGLGPNLLTSADALHMRGIYALPLIFIVAVQGAVAVAAFARGRWQAWRGSPDAAPRRLPAWPAAAAILALLAWHAAGNAGAYFRDWALAEPTQRIYNADFRLAARYLDAHADGAEIFIGTDRMIDLDSRTYALYEPQRTDANWFRLPGNPPLPSEGSGIYLGPVTAGVPPLLEFLIGAGGARQEQLLDEQGRALMWVVRLTPEILQKSFAGVVLHPLGEPVTYDATAHLDEVGWQDLGDHLLLATRWTALGPWPHAPDPGFPLLQPKASYSLSDAAGYEWVRFDAPALLPVHNVRPGLPMLELAQADLPADMPAGRYILRLVLYDEKGGALDMQQGAGRFVHTPMPVAELELGLRPLAAAPAAPFAVDGPRAGDALQATGSWDLPPRLFLSVPASLHITWQPPLDLETAGLAFVTSAEDQAGRPIWHETSTVALPATWEANRALRLTHRLAPAGAPVGSTSVDLQICAMRAGAALGCARWQDVEVINRPPLLVLEQPPQKVVDAHWDNGLSLAGYDLRKDATGSGLTLYWHAEAAAPAPVKRFVHLLDRQGRIVAQADVPLEYDSVPVTYWRAGEYVLDEVHFPAPEIAGAQRVCVGLYDPATEQNVPVSNATGEPAADARVCFE